MLPGRPGAGAARDYPKAFVDDYLRMVRACAEHDRDEVILRSTRMGFLTGTLLRCGATPQLGRLIHDCMLWCQAPLVIAHTECTECLQADS